LGSTDNDPTRLQTRGDIKREQIKRGQVGELNTNQVTRGRDQTMTRAHGPK